MLTALEIDPQDYGRDRVLQPITGFRIGLRGARRSMIRYRETVSYGIRRCEFDDYLLRRSGARLFTGEPVRSLGAKLGPGSSTTAFARRCWSGRAAIPAPLPAHWAPIPAASQR